MGGRIRSAALALSLLLLVPLGQADGRTAAPQRPDPPETALQQASVTDPESVTGPEPEKPLVVPAAHSSNTRGWTQGKAAAPESDLGIRPELVAAYTLAVALAPTECHLSLSLLAAIGQVESGNLAGRPIDARDRVVPAVLGPVLDGNAYAAIPDTDDGEWDGNLTWDRALGPLQFLPATWRVVGVDADSDGRRDPQNVYDAAAAAMVYLCDGGRDLSTREGLEEAVLAYNHSRDYLRLVLAWKDVFDSGDFAGLGLIPPMGAWAVPTFGGPLTTKAAGGSPSRLSGADRSGTSGPETTETSARGSAATPTTVTAADPADRPAAVPTASNPPAPTREPSPKPGGEPGDTPGGEPGDTPGGEPGETPDPGVDPTCPPPDETTPTAEPSASPTDPADPCAIEPTTPTPSEGPTP